jgi:hypothetical protein
MAVNPVSAISDMVAPVVLISVGIVILNGLIASYAALVDRSKVGKLGELETKPKKMVRRIAFAILFDLIATGSFMLSVLFIALAESQSNVVAGKVAIWFIIAGIDCLFVAIVIVGIAYRGGTGLLVPDVRRVIPDARASFDGSATDPKVPARSTYRGRLPRMPSAERGERARSPTPARRRGR